MCAYQLANCRKCKKVFQKHLTDLCSVCIETEQNQFSKLYHLLQTSAPNGIVIEDLAKEVNMPADAIEEMYIKGQLGTAAPFLRFKCKTCSTITDGRRRKGRFCLSCSEETARKAGVTVKSFNEIEQQEKEETLLAQLTKKQGPVATRDLATKKYGFYKG
ncbi:MAG: hypothetical protein KTR14_07680 [Vampirovibrio sp.]|nr:hypothetical protein [Vampirovibrio sp.]